MHAVTTWFSSSGKSTNIGLDEPSKLQNAGECRKNRVRMRDRDSFQRNLTVSIDVLANVVDNSEGRKPPPDVARPDAPVLKAFPVAYIPFKSWTSTLPRKVL
jgi:hypothetical protein